MEKTEGIAVVLGCPKNSARNRFDVFKRWDDGLTCWAAAKKEVRASCRWVCKRCKKVS